MFGLAKKVSRKELVEMAAAGQKAHERMNEIRRELAPPDGIISDGTIAHLAVCGNELAFEHQRLSAAAVDGMRAERDLREKDLPAWIENRERELKEIIRNSQAAEARARAELGRLAMKKLEAE